MTIKTTERLTNREFRCYLLGLANGLFIGLIIVLASTAHG